MKKRRRVKLKTKLDLSKRTKPQLLNCDVCHEPTKCTEGVIAVTCSMCVGRCIPGKAPKKVTTKRKTKKK